MEQATRGAHRSRVTDVRLFSNLHPLLIARFLSFCVSAAHRISMFGGSVTNPCAMQALRKTVSVGVRMGQRRMAGNMGVHKNRAVEVRPMFLFALMSRSVRCAPQPTSCSLRASSHLWPSRVPRFPWICAAVV